MFPVECYPDILCENTATALIEDMGPCVDSHLANACGYRTQADPKSHLFPHSIWGREAHG